jgi:hypothetical protein
VEPFLPPLWNFIDIETTLRQAALRFEPSAGSRDESKILWRREDLAEVF